MTTSISRSESEAAPDADEECSFAERQEVDGVPTSLEKAWNFQSVVQVPVVGAGACVVPMSGPETQHRGNVSVKAALYRMHLKSLFLLFLSDIHRHMHAHTHIHTYRHTHARA